MEGSTVIIILLIVTIVVLLVIIAAILYYFLYVVDAQKKSKNNSSEEGARKEVNIFKVKYIRRDDAKTAKEKVVSKKQPLILPDGVVNSRISAVPSAGAASSNVNLPRTSSDRDKNQTTDDNQKTLEGQTMLKSCDELSPPIGPPFKNVCEAPDRNSSKPSSNNKKDATFKPSLLKTSEKKYGSGKKNDYETTDTDDGKQLVKSKSKTRDGKKTTKTVTAVSKGENVEPETTTQEHIDKVRKKLSADVEKRRIKQTPVRAPGIPEPLIEEESREPSNEVELQQKKPALPSKKRSSKKTGERRSTENRKSHRQPQETTPQLQKKTVAMEEGEEAGKKVGESEPTDGREQ